MWAAAKAAMDQLDSALLAPALFLLSYEGYEKMELIFSLSCVVFIISTDRNNYKTAEKDRWVGLLNASQHTAMLYIFNL